MVVDHPYESLGRDGFIVLKILATRGIIVDPHEVGRIANCCNCLDVLQFLEGRGLCICADGVWHMTSQGEEAVKVAQTLDRDNVDEKLRAKLYKAFEPLDKRVKEIATRWQMKGDEVNTHDDADYDFSVLEELMHHHAEVLQYLKLIMPVWRRMEDYQKRLSEAIRRIENGEIEYVVGVDIPSYHTLWFEMHEDLINCCGVEREE